MGRKKVLFVTTFIIFVIVCTRILFHLHLNPEDDEFTNIELCPACYGRSLCPQFYHSDISLIGLSKLKHLRSAKNVYTGKLSKERVILKKLAHDSELIEIDKLLCKKANLGSPCHANEAMQLLVKPSIYQSNAYHLINLMHYFNSSTDISHCPTERLLSYIFRKINVEQRDFDELKQMEIFRLGEIFYSLIVNPEAVILQVFPQSEGWPFPQYYGACGRVIVEEYIGRTIAYYEDSPWKQRLDISYQLLLIAQMLTENDLDFALYMTDVNMDNFAVRPDGTVLLIDVESIAVVDRLKIKEDQALQNKYHHSKGEFCKDCLNFSFEDLCNHDLSDHNYYAICKGLLVPGSYYSSRGFLHNIPKDTNIRTNLEALVKECADPSKLLIRFDIVPKILQVMKSLL